MAQKAAYILLYCAILKSIDNFSPNFFKDIKISALSLLKMVMHARSGGTLEVMGLLLGKVDGNTMFVMDSFALPVEGTETRVNAQAQAYEYMSSYITSAKLVSCNLLKRVYRNARYNVRLDVKKMRLVGITVTPDTAAGYQESMYQLR